LALNPLIWQVISLRSVSATDNFANRSNGRHRGRFGGASGEEENGKDGEQNASENNNALDHSRQIIEREKPIQCDAFEKLIFNALLTRYEDSIPHSGRKPKDAETRLPCPIRLRRGRLVLAFALLRFHCDFSTLAFALFTDGSCFGSNLNIT
jgi:hypothetical protein